MTKEEKKFHPLLAVAISMVFIFLVLYLFLVIIPSLASDCKDKRKEEFANCYSGCDCKEPHEAWKRCMDNCWGKIRNCTRTTEFANNTLKKS
jgi:hypothetical protein